MFVPQKSHIFYAAGNPAASHFLSKVHILDVHIHTFLAVSDSLGYLYKNFTLDIDFLGFLTEAS